MSGMQRSEHSNGDSHLSMSSNGDMRTVPTENGELGHERFARTSTGSIQEIYREEFRDITRPLLDRHLSHFPEDDMVALTERAQLATLLSVVFRMQGVENLSTQKVVSRALWCEMGDDFHPNLRELFDSSPEKIRELSQKLIPLHIDPFTRSLNEPEASIFERYHLEGLSNEQVALQLNLGLADCKKYIEAINARIGQNGSLSDFSGVQKYVPVPAPATKPERNANPNREKPTSYDEEDPYNDDFMELKPRKGQSELVDFQKLLNHRVLSHEETFQLFREYRESRSTYIQEVFRSPLVISRAVDFYQDLYMEYMSRAENNKDKFESSMGRLQAYFWSLESNILHDFYSNFLQEFPELAEISTQLGRTENEIKRQALIERAAILMGRFPLDFPHLSEFVTELKAYSDELATSADEDERAEFLCEIGEGEQEALARLEKIYNAQNTLEDTRDTLMRHNQKLVFWSAKRYFYKGFAVSDILQEGNLGLMTAVERFDPDFGNTFATYAPYWIRQAVLRMMDNERSSIRMPVHAQETIRKAYKKYLEDRQETGDARDFKDVVENYLQEDYMIKYVRRSGANPTSFDLAIGDSDDDGTLGDFCPDHRAATPGEEYALSESFQILFETIDTCLRDKDKIVICARFGIAIDDYGCERTLEEIGTLLGITRERVRQLEKRAFNDLRQSLFMNEPFKELLRNYFNVTDIEEFDIEEHFRLMLSGED